jgi:hypothetical protein
MSHYMVCDRVRVSFNAPTPQLHPLPIMGLGYHWSLDFARPLLMHSQLLEGLKSESKHKTAEGERVGARSLTHNTLRGRGACWSFRMGLGRVDKLYSLTQACTQPTQGG